MCKRFKKISCFQVIYKKFVIECPLFDPEVGANNITVVYENFTTNLTLDHANPLDTESENYLADQAHAAHNINVSLTPEQELGLKFYHEFGPQECEAKAVALTDKVSFFVHYVKHFLLGYIYYCYFYDEYFFTTVEILIQNHTIYNIHVCL